MRPAGPLAHQPFRWLLAARTTSLLGNAIAPVALAFAVLDLTGRAGDVGIVVASRSLTNVLLLLFGGVLADRLPRQLVLTGSSLAAAGTQGLVAALVLSDQATVPLLALLSAANGAVAAIAFPASSALTPQTVPASALQAANAMLRLSMNSAAILGAIVGGVLIAVAGPGYGLAVDAAAYALAALLFRGVQVVGGRSVGTASTGVLADLRGGWTEFTSRRWTWVVVAQFTVVNAAFVGTATVLGPVVADDTVGRAAYGLVLAAQTVGLLLGGLVALRWRPDRPLRIGVALTVLSAAPATALALSPTLAVLLVAAVVAGFAIEQFGVAWDVALQQHVPADRLARVYSYDAVGSFVAIPVGEVAVGPLSGLIGLRPTLLGCAAAISLATVLALSTTSVRDLQRLPTYDQGRRPDADRSGPGP